MTNEQEKATVRKCAFPPCQVPVEDAPEGSLGFCERHTMDHTREWVEGRRAIETEARALVTSWGRRGKRKLSVREQMLADAVNRVEALEA